VTILSPIWAVTPEEFEAVVNVDASIADLARLVEQERFEEIDVERYYILEGSVAATWVFSSDPETFQAVIALAESRWVGLDRIEMYEVYVLVTDPAFAARLPERLPRDPGPEIIQTNQRLLVIGPFVGTAPDLNNPEDPEGGLLAVVQAVTIR
jgi:hypothetical protein